MKNEIGFDGFSNSYVKSPNNVTIKEANKFDTVLKYEQFLKANLT